MPMTIGNKIDSFDWVIGDQSTAPILVDLPAEKFGEDVRLTDFGDHHLTIKSYLDQDPHEAEVYITNESEEETFLSFSNTYLGENAVGRVLNVHRASEGFYDNLIANHHYYMYLGMTDRNTDLFNSVYLGYLFIIPRGAL